jgi:hypothetical protein
MALLAGEGGHPVDGRVQTVPDQTRAARDSGLYRMAAGLQAGGAAVNGR